jgi:hypothetical protein
VDDELTEEDPQRPAKPSLGARLRSGKRRDRRDTPDAPAD